ncbi:hypothetical protein B0H13DRAFT_1905670 [Mycena leptocephala]|nr:hypothetical protein B0H13DRAFT_1905670 [Mycena leptocephala]
MLSELAADRARVAEIEAQIVDLERSISQLRAAKALAEERLHSYTYPVMTLPNEIVSEIFLAFLPVYPLRSPLAGIHSPTFLTRICRRWRDVALATPELWRAIDIGSLENHISFERQLDVFDGWLTRSRSCPLSIYIKDGVNPSDIFSLLLPHHARCEYLKLHLVESQPIFERPMPLLRHLDLVLNIPPSISSFRQVPLLRTVVLNEVAIMDITLPWMDLTSLTLCWVTPSEYLPILQQTSNLVHCELSLFYHFDGDDLGPTSTIVLPCLESLTLRRTSSGNVTTGHLDTLTAPALRSLTVPERFLGSNPLELLTSFISRSSCKLQELHITERQGSNEDSYRHAFPWNNWSSSDVDSDPNSE